ncbi:hypothetical protein QR680_015840 [Steinernema hermaphroditum]|uniref:7TM GPCR serpentine receptor class x (Srx) domain-containing protein n=1 Tax=Steinernema hermaphroditum TaxID=289476 RepID=A0AA39HB00_9BILA|nr:hypothetical protein QR680_015840 [Steinernema hermaphroditum]
MNKTSDVAWGRELQGRGELSKFEALIGLSIWMMSMVTVAIGLLNLYVIKNVTIFHNAFGAFWVSRTIGEIGANIVNLIYSGPVTFLQPKDIPPQLGIAAYSVELFFAAEACAMNQYVSANRMLAVCAPVKYNHIFTKRLIAAIITVTWVEVAAVTALYFLIPCSIVGYSPQFYNYVFVRSPNCDHNYSVLNSFISRGCTAVCSLSLLLDGITFYKILQIKVTNKSAAKDEHFRRNVRFFAQTAVQNVTMVTSLILWVVVTSRPETDDTVLHVFEFDSRIMAYLSNGLAIIIFNPEVRKMLGSRFSSKVESTNGTNGLVASH